ncbi:hypothetical protein PSQ90_01240 [Devosia rhodophyticola]|uniref:NADH-quinone oxidoreductase subunit E n=1 Tax=Devosia rhodophyticola TaxID=3026423 RepID=A0ABY7YXJ7_9HYPH|nr:hypothetical protein [Devosia rhodophyticola]WDR06113.1 hypothetical protein PSQ90_01240 [Devosia rhodophyticola]
MFNLAYLGETALLLLIAYLLGCLIGYAMRKATLRSSHQNQDSEKSAPIPIEVPKVQPPQVPKPVEQAPPPRARPINPAVRLAMSSPPEPEPVPKAEPDIRPAVAAEDPTPTTAAEPPKPKPKPVRKSKSRATSTKPARPRKPADPKPAALATPRPPGKDDLKQIKGIGPKIESTLNELGVFHFDQIAGWTKANADWMDTHLSFKGRVTRESWIAQAKKLSKKS